MTLTVKTPCIGVCSTGLGDPVCRGCKRFSHEVIHWNSYAQPEKASVLARIDSLFRQVVESRIDIVDQNVLRDMMFAQNIRFDASLSPYSWVFQLLKAGAKQIDHIEDFGCRVVPPWTDLSLEELKQSIDEDIYYISCLHQERYFKELI